MFKKTLVVAISAIFMTACASNSTTSNTKTVSAEPKFKITDEQINAYILELNNFEQCVYPQLKGLNFEQADKQVYSKIVGAERTVKDKYYNNILHQIIGNVNYNIYVEDEASQDYFHNKHVKFNHQYATGWSEEDCEKFKVRFQQRVAEEKNRQ